MPRAPEPTKASLEIVEEGKTYCNVVKAWRVAKRVKQSFEAVQMSAPFATVKGPHAKRFAEMIVAWWEERHSEVAPLPEGTEAEFQVFSKSLKQLIVRGEASHTVVFAGGATTPAVRGFIVHGLRMVQTRRDSIDTRKVYFYRGVGEGVAVNAEVLVAAPAPVEDSWARAVASRAAAILMEKQQAPKPKTQEEIDAEIQAARAENERKLQEILEAAQKRKENEGAQQADG